MDLKSLKIGQSLVVSEIIGSKRKIEFDGKSYTRKELSEMSVDAKQFSADQIEALRAAGFAVQE